jgi:hypothetical protein
MKRGRYHIAPASCRVRAVIRFFSFNYSMGILLTEFMAPGTTITSEVYCETLNIIRRSNQTNGLDDH